MSEATTPDGRWQAWSARFAALQSREKGLIVAALACAVLFGGYSLWVAPARDELAATHKTLERQARERQELAQQEQALHARQSDPAAADRQAIAQLRERLTASQREIEEAGARLLPPQRMPALLQSLLARHPGLTLVGLATLSPQALVAVPAGNAPPDATGPATRTVTAGNLYRHGIELTLRGSFSDLLAYAAELDAHPQPLLRGALALEVKQYPVSELKLTIYTLSLETAWLVV